MNTVSVCLFVLAILVIPNIAAQEKFTINANANTKLLYNESNNDFDIDGINFIYYKYNFNIISKCNYQNNEYSVHFSMEHYKSYQKLFDRSAFIYLFNTHICYQLNYIYEANKNNNLHQDVVNQVHIAGPGDLYVQIIYGKYNFPISMYFNKTYISYPLECMLFNKITKDHSVLLFCVINNG